MAYLCDALRISCAMRLNQDTKAQCIMNTKTQTDLNIDSKYNQIQAILFLLQENLDEFKDEVDRSYELLKIGELTNLAKK